jgi:hypothetical protein
VEVKGSLGQSTGLDEVGKRRTREALLCEQHRGHVEDVSAGLVAPFQRPRAGFPCPHGAQRYIPTGRFVK